MPFASPQDVTDRGILVFKRVEDGLTQVMQDILKLHPVFDGANELQMPHTGINETRRINAKIDVAYGFVARIVSMFRLQAPASDAQAKE